MLGRLFILFTTMTLVEVYVLMSLGSFLGAELTVGIILITAFLGSYLVRNQGLLTVQKLQARLAAGEVPGEEIAEGFMLLVCGILLVAPGFVTDGLGLLVLTPAIRSHLAKTIIAKYKDRIISQSIFTGAAQGFHYSSTNSSPFQQPGSSHAARKEGVIEGDFVEMDIEQISDISKDIEKEAVIIDEDAVVIDEDVVVIDEGVVVIEKDAVVIDEDAVVIDKDAVVIDEDAVVIDEDAVVIDEDAVVIDKDAVVIDEDAVVIDKDAVGKDNNNKSS